MPSPVRPPLSSPSPDTPPDALPDAPVTAGAWDRDALDAAREEIREQALFLARLSHEVRRPLSAAFDYARLLRATPLTSEQAGLLDEMTVAGDALLTLLNHVHAYARLGLADVLDAEGQTHVQPSESVDVVELAENALDHVEAHAREHGVRLALVHEAALPERFTGDAEGVRACLTRVLQHVAPLATDELTVSVGGTWDDDGPVKEARDRRVGDLFRLRVNVQASTGDPVDAETLFVPFSLPPVAGTAPRSGLELPLARRLATSLGGSLTARSGARTLVVTLDVPMRVDTPPIPASTLLLAGHRALVVTAHAPTAAMLTRYLERAGIDTHVAAPPDAATAASWSGIDVAIVDGTDAAALALAGRAIAHGTTVVQVGGPPADHAGSIVLPPLVRRAALLDALTDTLRAPMAVGTPEDAFAEPSAADASRPLRVLLVEDNLINQRVAQHLLGRLGIAPDVALNGLEAVERAAEVAYDLVLMDVMMPVMDGIEATQRIRQRIGPQPRIVAVTANAMPGDRERCLAVGMDDYLAKPVQLDGLARVLRACRPFVGTGPEHPATDVLDLPTLRDLRGMIGDDDDAFLDGLVADYEADAAHLARDLHAAIASGDIETARRAAHTLKSSSGMIGARPLSEQAAAIEAACDRATFDDARRAADGLDACLAATRQALSALRASGFAGL